MLDLVYSIKPKDIPYGMDELCKLVGVRGAKWSRAHQQEFKQFWQACFFTDEWQKHDEPAPGAVAFVHALLESGIHIVYLTGRDILNMRHGVVDALLTHGFPMLEAGTSLVCKPTFQDNDKGFKARVVDQLVLQHFNLVALVDNEPPIVNMAANHNLLGVHFTGSTWVGKDPLHEDVVTLASFVL